MCHLVSACLRGQWGSQQEAGDEAERQNRRAERHVGQAVDRSRQKPLHRLHLPLKKWLHSFLPSPARMHADWPDEACLPFSIDRHEAQNIIFSQSPPEQRIPPFPPACLDGLNIAKADNFAPVHLLIMMMLFVCAVSVMHLPSLCTALQPTRCCLLAGQKACPCHLPRHCCCPLPPHFPLLQPRSDQTSEVLYQGSQFFLVPNLLFMQLHVIS